MTLQNQPDPLPAAASHRADAGFSAVSSSSTTQSLRNAVQYLCSLQHQQGYWAGELEADSSLESDAIMLDHYLGDPRQDRVRKLAVSIRDQQMPDGGWALHPGGPPNISLIVKAYLALRLAGFPESDPALKKAQKLALELGGVEAANSYTRIYLCLYGLYDWRHVPAVVPEIILIPNLAYFNLYELSAWTRSIVVPLSVIYSFHPKKTPPHGVNLKGLYTRPDGKPPAPLSELELNWRSFFHTADRVLADLERRQWMPLRRQALKKAEQWILERLEGSDGLGAIYPAMMNSILALDCLGYRHDHPIFRRELELFWNLALEDDRSMWMQPCYSPVWDTAQSLYTVAVSSMAPDNSALCRAAEWLISKQILKSGDWSARNPKGVAGGWAFEFNNDPFPDVDDTAMVLLALSSVRLPDEARQRDSLRRGLEWVLSMQCNDGGWASFDVNINKSVLCHVPFADHNAMIDPSTSDITGRVLETLAALGFNQQFGPARRAIDFIFSQQESDGCWHGRWGVNYIYGTCFALRGLAAIGIDMREGACVLGSEWIRSCQNSDGGWGESCDSYENPEYRGRGPSTAAQTAWALLGLFATDDFDSESVRFGIQYLLKSQDANGGWTDGPFTGTGFPGVFYLKYHYYSVYFPMLALSEYLHRRSPGSNAQRPDFADILQPS